LRHGEAFSSTVNNPRVCRTRPARRRGAPANKLGMILGDRILTYLDSSRQDVNPSAAQRATRWTPFGAHRAGRHVRLRCLAIGPAMVTGGPVDWDLIPRGRARRAFALWWLPPQSIASMS
jgi:hypothetical protein